MQHFQEVVTNLVGGNRMVAHYIVLFIEATTLVAVAHVLFQRWKIQPRGWKLKRTGIELLVIAIGGPITGILVGGLNRLLALIPPAIHAHVISAPTTWGMIAIEFTLFCLGFDTWFYWWHRFMHKEPYYKYIHKIHHWSTSPSPITTFSVSPFESLINGGFLAIFTALIPVHAASLKFMGPSFVIMGVYVHLGYELLPRWWNRTWLTKWFITSTFHDQHHKYFNWNYGGFFQIWDYACGTVRPKYEADFEKIAVKIPPATLTPAALPAE